MRMVNLLLLFIILMSRFILRSRSDPQTENKTVTFLFTHTNVKKETVLEDWNTSSEEKSKLNTPTLFWIKNFSTFQQKLYTPEQINEYTHFSFLSTDQ